MIPGTPGSRAAERAVNVLLAAGMVLRYRSKYGNSFYLGWPGRSGVLRVSDHANTTKLTDSAILSRLTFSDVLTRDIAEETFRRRVAHALGTYLMKSKPGEPTKNPFGSDWIEIPVPDEPPATVRGTFPRGG